MKTTFSTQTNSQTSTLCNECAQENAVGDRLCIRCQMALVEDARQAEAEAYAAMRRGKAEILRPEMLVPRLGERLVEMGLLGDADLDHALWTQRKRASDGESILLGKLLIELGYITNEQLDRAVTEQVLELRDELRRSNRNLENRVKERTAQLQDALVKLSEFGQLKADFVANVSHELRTPLTLLGGYLAMVADGSLGALNDEQQQALTIASRAGEKLGKLIEDLLQFSEATIGAVPVQRVHVSMEIPVHRALDQACVRAREREVTLTAELPKRLPTVRADTEKITWVIGELLTNAIKFTPPGGSVTIQASAAEDRVTVTILDSGVGIPEERIEEAFEPFHQLDGSTTRHYGGTGLGLALARRILEAHGSGVEVKSELGHGSSFSFSLPVVS